MSKVSEAIDELEKAVRMFEGARVGGLSWDTVARLEEETAMARKNLFRVIQEEK